MKTYRCKCGCRLTEHGTFYFEDGVLIGHCMKHIIHDIGELNDSIISGSGLSK